MPTSIPTSLPPLSKPCKRDFLRGLCALAVGAATGALAPAVWAAPGDATGSAAGKLHVVTTFTVIADMARNVAGDAAVVESITKPGAEIHGYQPTPGDIRKAQSAQLILRNGLGLEAWFEQFFKRLRNVPGATVSDGIAPISIDAGAYRGKPNPHAWMSPRAALVYVDNIRNALSEHDPDNAATYAANAQAYKAQIEATLAPLQAQIEALAPEQRWLVTSEGAFSYLARDLGLRELYLWPVNADQQGTPQQIRRVIDAINTHRPAAIFSESTISPAPAQQVARETGIHYGGVLYVDSLSAADGPVPTYLDLLRVTVQTIAQGLAAGAAAQAQASTPVPAPEPAR